MRIWMFNVLNRMLQNEFECWNNGIAKSHHHSSLNWMTVLRTCFIFANVNDTNLDLIGQSKFEWWENEIEWRIGCAWPKSSKLNAHKMNSVDKITKLLIGKTYIILKHIQINSQFRKILMLKVRLSILGQSVLFSLVWSLKE